MIVRVGIEIVVAGRGRELVGVVGPGAGVDLGGDRWCGRWKIVRNCINILKLMKIVKFFLSL